MVTKVVSSTIPTTVAALPEAYKDHSGKALECSSGHLMMIRWTQTIQIIDLIRGTSHRNQLDKLSASSSAIIRISPRRQGPTSKATHSDLWAQATWPQLTSRTNSDSILQVSHQGIILSKSAALRISSELSPIIASSRFRIVALTLHNNSSRVTLSVSILAGRIIDKTNSSNSQC